MSLNKPQKRTIILISGRLPAAMRNIHRHFMHFWKLRTCSYYVCLCVLVRGCAWLCVPVHVCACPSVAVRACAWLCVTVRDSACLCVSECGCACLCVAVRDWCRQWRCRRHFWACVTSRYSIIHVHVHVQQRRFNRRQAVLREGTRCQQSVSQSINQWNEQTPPHVRPYATYVATHGALRRHAVSRWSQSLSRYT